jgi:hypothetical protein
VAASLSEWKREAEKRTFFFMLSWREGFILNLASSVNIGEHPQLNMLLLADKFSNVMKKKGPYQKEAQ